MAKILILLLICAVMAQEPTYAPFVDKVFAKINELRADMSELVTRLNPEASDEAKALMSEGIKMKPLNWSDGLANGCRDLILENGPSGFAATVTREGSFSAADFADVYGQAKYRPLDRVVFIQPNTFVLNKREPLQVLLDTINEDYYALYEFFNDGFTDIGISCGCHSEMKEMCVFLLAMDYSQKHGVKRMDLKV